MGGLQFLGEGSPDLLLSALDLLCKGLRERTDAGALVEVGVIGVPAGPDEVDDLVAGVELRLVEVVESAHEVQRLRLVRGTSPDGGDELLEGLEREGADLHFAMAFDRLELIADVGEGRGQDDADERQMACGETNEVVDGRIAIDEEFEERLFAADHPVECVAVVPKPIGDRVVGEHYAVLHPDEGLPGGLDIRGELAFGEGGQELGAGLIEGDGAGKGEAFAEPVVRLLRERGDLIAADDDVLRGGFDSAD